MILRAVEVILGLGGGLIVIQAGLRHWADRQRENRQVQALQVRMSAEARLRALTDDTVREMRNTTRRQPGQW